MTDIKHDPELPFVVTTKKWPEGTSYVIARFNNEEDAVNWAESPEPGSHEDGTEVIDTTPKPKIPEDTEFILVETEDVAKDIYQRVEDKNEDSGFYWYRAVDSMAYGHEEMPDMIGDAEVTVLVRKEAE